MDAVLRSRRNNFVEQPPADGTPRKLGVTADQIQSHGIDVSKALSSGGTGLVWTAVRDGNAIARAKRDEIDGRPVTRASVVQVTNLGITVKDSPQNTLVFVTRLDNGAPVPGARVSIVRTDNTTHWRGDHRQRRHRPGTGHAAARPREAVGVLVHRDRRERRRRRLHRQRLERGN